jgi:hypothetical protein
MFAYNFMVTTIRAITQDLDLFVSEYATLIEHAYVDKRSLSEEMIDALRGRGPVALPAVCSPAPKPEAVVTKLAAVAAN